MSLFKKHKAAVQPIPEPFTAEDIRVESSICTGEKTIGFYDKHAYKLRFAEFVRSEQDIIDYFERYGADVDSEIIEKLMTG
jgi:hypothetical protein